MPFLSGLALLPHPRIRTPRGTGTVRNSDHVDHRRTRSGLPGGRSRSAGDAVQLRRGVMLLVFRPFDVDDYIEVAGQAGTCQVDRRILDHTQHGRQCPDHDSERQSLRRGDQELLRQRHARVDLVTSVAYSDDLQVARDTLSAILEADERVLDDPAAVVAVSEFGSLVRRTSSSGPGVPDEDYWAFVSTSLARSRNPSKSGLFDSVPAAGYAPHGT